MLSMTTTQATAPTPLLSSALEGVITDFTGRLERSSFQAMAQERDPFYFGPYDETADERAEAYTAVLPRIAALAAANLPARELRKAMSDLGLSLEAEGAEIESGSTAAVVRAAGAALITASASPGR